MSEEIKRVGSEIGMGDYYICKRCGYQLPKKEAKISGWEDSTTTPPLHCPKCGHKVAVTS